MHPIRATLVLTLIAGASSARAAAQAPFPGHLPGTSIGGGLPSGFEASGAVWHPRLQRLLVVSDDGRLTALEASGALPTTRSVAGDLEDVCVANPATDFVYLGLESPDSVLELRLSTGAVTRSFNLTPWMTGPDNQGLEALTFVPDSSDPEGGLFHAGLQNDGTVHVFRLPIASSATSTAVTQVRVYSPVPGRTDISGLNYDPATDSVYAIFDSANRIARLTRDGVFLQEWVLPGDNQEGVAIRGCELFVAQDQPSPSLIRYGAFPSGAACEPLSADAASVSVGSGGAVGFSLHAGAFAPAGHLYLLLGSASGTVPGFDLPPIHLVLNPDWYFDYILGQANLLPFVATFGTLDASAAASSQLVVPAGLSASLVGLQLHHAYLTADPVTYVFSGASSATSLTFVP